MSEFSFRACCHEAPAGAGFYEKAGTTGPLTMPQAPILEESAARPAFETDRVVAWHEAGHALAAIVVGAKVARVALSAPNPFASHEGLPEGLFRTVVAMAGPFAEGIAKGLAESTPDPVAIEFWARVNAPSGGGCDMCQALRPCVAKAGLDRQTEALALFRRAERAALSLMDHEDARRFLRVAAAELLAAGELPGQRIHEIADTIIGPEQIRQLRADIGLRLAEPGDLATA